VCNCSCGPREYDHGMSELVQIQGFKKITNQFREMYRIHPNLINKYWKISTCNWLDWDTLGYHLIMPKNLPQRGMWWTLTLPYELLGEAVSTLAGSRAHDVATPQKKRKEKKTKFWSQPKIVGHPDQLQKQFRRVAWGCWRAGPNLYPYRDPSPKSL
jgi:hypothetical protein